MNVTAARFVFENQEPRSIREVLSGFERAAHGSLAGRIYAIIRRNATELRLLPNQLLSEKDVSASLDTSKTPVREAFIRLAEDGVVRIVPHSGTYVAPIDADVAKEGHLVFVALFSSCAAKAAEQRSLADIGRLRAIVDAIGESAAARQLIDCIFAVADIPDARALIAATQFETERVRFLFGGDEHLSISDVLLSLSALVNAIVDKDAAAAERCAERCFERQATRIAALSSDKTMRELIGRLNLRKPEPRRPRTA